MAPASDGLARWQRVKQWCLPELLSWRNFHQILASLAHALKLVNESPSPVTQCFSSFYLCTRTQSELVPEPFKSGVSVFHSPLAFPAEGHGNPLQYSCLENPMDRGAWWSIWGPLGHKELDTTEVTQHACMPALPNISPVGFQNQMLHSSYSWCRFPGLGSSVRGASDPLFLVVSTLLVGHHTRGVGSSYQIEFLSLLPVSMWSFLHILSGRKSVLLVLKSFSGTIVLYVAVVLMCP